VLYVAQDGEARRPVAIGENAEQLLGFTSAELCNEPELFLAHVHPDDRVRLREELAAARGAAYLPLKYRFVHRSGRVIWCRETQVAQAGAGMLGGITVDVTELELPRRALQAALAAADARGAVLAICEAAAQSFGLDWTLYLDARKPTQLFNQHGPLGAVIETSWEDAPPREPLVQQAETARAVDWIDGAVAARLSPELRARCVGAQFGFAVAVAPATSQGPAGVLLGLARKPLPTLFTYQRALEQLARQGAVALQRAELIDALRRTGRERQQLSEALLRTHEAERARLARELHDGAGQTLTAVAIQLDLAEQFAKPEALAPLARARQQIERTLEELRRLSHALRPAALDDLGLADALAEMGHSMQTPALAVRVEAPVTLPALGGDLATGLFRIAQAALTNVVRHAQATRATLRLEPRSEGGMVGISLEIEDDGRGIIHSEGLGIGLLTMRERAHALGGTFAVESAPGRGARLTVFVPLKPAPPI
jgi:signal transduction histidine kinase